MLLTEAAHYGWEWAAVDAQIVISNYGLVIVTTLATIIEIYKLTKIEHELKLITRILRVIKAPLRTRRLIAKRTEARIVRQAAHHSLAAPDGLIKAQAIRAQADRVIRANNGRHF